MKFNWIVAIALLVPQTAIGQAFSTMPYIFVNGQAYNPSQLQADFQAIVNQGNAVGAFLESQIAANTPPPSGSILWFNLGSCPVGWSNLGAGFAGRFVRGYDSGRGIDPIPQPVGGTEAATLQDHTHTFNGMLGIATTIDSFSAASGSTFTGLVNHVASTSTNHGVGAVAGARHGATTRPVNIALLLCQKL